MQLLFDKAIALQGELFDGCEYVYPDEKTNERNKNLSNILFLIFFGISGFNFFNLKKFIA